MRLVFPDGYKLVNEGLKRAIEQDFAENRSVNYLFVGRPGTGKTTFAKIIMQSYNRHLRQIHHDKTPWKAYDESEDCRMIRADGYAENRAMLLSSNYDDRNDEIRKLNALMNLNGLIIDDLGCEKESHRASLAQAISIRYDSYKKAKITIITTNLTEKQISFFYGERILDRIYEMCIISKFLNPSFRQRKEI